MAKTAKSKYVVAKRTKPRYTRGTLFKVMLVKETYIVLRPVYFDVYASKWKEVLHEDKDIAVHTNIFEKDFKAYRLKRK